MSANRQPKRIVLPSLIICYYLPAGISAEILVFGPSEQSVAGDLNGDGDVTIQDVMEACKVLARQSVGKAPTAGEMQRGDLDGDGRFTITDVMEICKLLARKA
ncbi:MAG: hypothetical protein HFE86_05615 [Clostridiales bacterium]|nr:hypothetical protein [Clostridiales bacterium]